MSNLCSSVTSVQQRRTKVFHFLTYHKGKKKTFKQDVSSTAASSRPSSLSLATVLVTFYWDSVFEFAVFVFIYLHIYVVEFTSSFFLAHLSLLISGTSSAA